MPTDVLDWRRTPPVEDPPNLTNPREEGLFSTQTPNPSVACHNRREKGTATSRANLRLPAHKYTVSALVHEDVDPRTARRI